MAKRSASKSGRNQSSKLRILVSNDDGINAPGLKVAEKIARTVSSDVWVVAPETEQSGASHALTLHEPLRVRKISTRRYAVRGTPTDCVIMALNQILQGKSLPDLLISGVNRGTNIGEDITYSGTVAAAMEGMLLGIPSIAISQSYTSPHPVKWGTAEHHGPIVLGKLLKEGWPENVLINVNFPDVMAGAVKDIVATVQGQRDAANIIIDERIDSRMVPYYWIGFRRHRGVVDPKSDMAVVWGGGISVTPLHIDLTHRQTRQALEKAFR
jgi:5'/3'-nucleotidase SurE